MCQRSDSASSVGSTRRIRTPCGVGHSEIVRQPGVPTGGRAVLDDLARRRVVTRNGQPGVPRHGAQGDQRRAVTVEIWRRGRRAAGRGRCSATRTVPMTPMTSCGPLATGAAIKSARVVLLYPAVQPSVALEAVAVAEAQVVPELVRDEGGRRPVDVEVAARLDGPAHGSQPGVTGGRRAAQVRDEVVRGPQTRSLRDSFHRPVSSQPVVVVVSPASGHSEGHQARVCSSRTARPSTRPWTPAGSASSCPRPPLAGSPERW